MNTKLHVEHPNSTRILLLKQWITVYEHELYHPHLMHTENWYRDALGRAITTVKQEIEQLLPTTQT